MDWDCSEKCMRLWEVGAQVAAAVATFTAVLVSLLLARRQVVRLKVSAMIATYSSQHPDRPSETHHDLVVTFQNTGYVDTVITSFRWQTKLLGNIALHVPDIHAKPGFPFKLEAQQVYHHRIRVSEVPQDWRANFRRLLIPKIPWLTVFLVRIVATTASGLEFSGRIDRKTQSYLLLGLKAWRPNSLYVSTPIQPE